MSAQSISRWNEIPLSRADALTQLKLSTSQLNNLDANAGVLEREEDPDDDDVSLVSRTPSPAIPDAEENLSKYDEYVRGTVREVITVETKIKPSNKGYALLTKLGWSDGQPLGLSGDARTEPIPFHVKADLTGLGKINQDVRMIETTVSQRRELDSERQQKETEEQRQARENSVLRRAALQTEITTTLKAFYCTLCEKQFKTVAQYDEHTNSYAHHHKARLKDMQASQRIIPQEEVDKRKEKERKREEKELRKIAAAAGIRMAKSGAQTTPSSSSNALVNTGSSGIDHPPAKKSGWASISSSSEPSGAQPGFKKSGWSTVGSTTSAELHVSLGSPARSAHAEPAAHGVATSAPSFRAAGWTSLDNTTAPPPPPSTKSLAATHLPPPPPQEDDGPVPAGPSSTTNRRNTATISAVPPGTPPVTNQTRPPSPPPVSYQGRSSWQQFKQGGSKRRR